MFKTPYVPNAPCASICSRGYLHVIWGCRGPSLCLDTPICLDASPCVHHPHTFVCFPVCLCSRGYLHVLWGEHPICWGSGGVSTFVKLLVSVSTSIGCPLCFILYLSAQRGPWGLALLKYNCPQPPHHLHLQFFKLVCFSKVLLNGEALHLTGLCLIWFRVSIFSFGPVLPCSIISRSFNIKVATAHHLLIQKEGG